MVRLVLASVVVGAAACSLPAGDYFGRIPDDPDVHHFRWCNSGEPDFLDPALASSTTSSPLVHALFDGLTTYGMDGLPVASLATGWESSPDLRTYTFHLRHGARWSDGREVTAYDLAYTALRVLHPLTASPNADNLAPIKNATGWFTRRVYALGRDVAPYRAGELVELASDATGPDLDRRTSTHALALRELGAPEGQAYARVPPGASVEVLWTSGGRATPGPAGWAYVFWATGDDGVLGWVPTGELAGAPADGPTLAIRRLAPKDVPGGAPGAADDAARPVVQVAARDLVRTTDAIGIAIPDPFTIVFECADPTPYFLSLTANRALRATPSWAISRWPRRWTRPDHIVTSGPMHLAEWRERDKVVLVRSPTYWNPGEVRIDKITSFSIDDQAAATNFYYTAGCDAVSANNIPSTYLPALNGEQRGKPYKDYSVAPYLGSYFAWINTEKLPNRHLRRALAYAIDRTQIPRFTHGNEIATAQLTPGTPIRDLSAANLAACGVTRETPGVALVMTDGELCYVPPPGLDLDLDAARRELAAARADGAVPSVLHYRYNAGSEAHKQIAEYLQAAWSRIGLVVQIEAQDWNSMLADTRAGNYEIVRFGNIGNVADTESEFLPMFRCASPDNRGKYCNPEFERRMDEARTIADRKLRNAKLREAEAVMIEDAPVLPLYAYTQKQLTKPYVKDLAINLIGQPPLWRVWIDPDWRHTASEASGRGVGAPAALPTGRGAAPGDR